MYVYESKARQCLKIIRESALEAPIPLLYFTNASISFRASYEC